MLIPLSTQREAARKRRVADNSPMGKKKLTGQEIAEFVARLDHVRDTCRAPGDAAFARWLDVSTARLGMWKRRGSYGDGDDKLHAVTGVSTDWLRTGKGVDFPAGPRIFSGPKVASEERVEALEVAVHAIISGIIVARLDVAGLIAGLMESDKNIHLLGEAKGLLPQLIGQTRAAEREQRQGKDSPRKRSQG